MKRYNLVSKETKLLKFYNDPNMPKIQDEITEQCLNQERSELIISRRSSTLSEKVISSLSKRMTTTLKDVVYDRKGWSALSQRLAQLSIFSCPLLNRIMIIVYYVKAIALRLRITFMIYLKIISVNVKGAKYENFR